ncbi:MAG: HAD family hydrolase, partial [Planktomarina sp.]
MNVKGVLFDKDGTLFDFQKTWNSWSARMIEHFSAGDAGRRTAIAKAVGFDLARQAFDLDSIVIAGTNRQVAECVAAVLPDQCVDEIEEFLM